jgi:hypothetical protein
MPIFVCKSIEIKPAKYGGMIRWTITILFFFNLVEAYSQQLAAFSDYRRHFMIFDNGQIKELDHLPAQSFRAGANCVAYVTNSGRFNVYYNRNVFTLSDNFVSKYFVSSNLMTYFVYDQMFVFDSGVTHLLSGKVKSYAIGDSILAFFNENTHSSHVYYKGEILTIERSLTGSPILEFKAGDNLIAYYNTNTKYLKAFYNGRLWNILKSSAMVPFAPGRNMLAYIDKSRNSFHVFNNGNSFQLEDYQPKSFQAGDDLVAYIDHLGEFKVFYQKKIITLSSFEPDFYDVKDSLVIFAELGYLKVFYKGEIVEFGNYVPTEYQAKENMLVFIGPNGWLKAFCNGKFIKVTSDFINSYSLNYNNILINTTLNKIKVYSNGKIHETN